MLRMVKWMVPALALGLLVGLSGHVLAAQDAAKGTISGTVTGTDGKPAANAMVQVRVAPVKGEKHEAKAENGEKPKHAEPAARAKTDDNGKFTVEVPAGEYVVLAGIKGEGRGHERITVAAGETANVSITLKAGDEKPAKHEKKGDNAGEQK